jgi:hypothetical protein
MLIFYNKVYTNKMYAIKLFDFTEMLSEHLAIAKPSLARSSADSARYLNI